MGEGVQFEDLDVQMDYPGYRDELICMDVGPQLRAVEQVVVKEKRFGRWRQGFRESWTANRDFMHVLHKSPLKPGAANINVEYIYYIYISTLMLNLTLGHPLVTAEDFIGETVIGLFPERYACGRYMPKHQLNEDGAPVVYPRRNSVGAGAAQIQKATAFPCPEHGFCHHVVFKRYVYRSVHTQVTPTFPKGQATAVAGNSPIC